MCVCMCVCITRKIHAAAQEGVLSIELDPFLSLTGSWSWAIVSERNGSSLDDRLEGVKKV